MTIGRCRVEQGSRREQWLGFLERQVVHYGLDETSYRSDDFAIDARGRDACDWKIGRVRTAAGRCRLIRDAGRIAGDGNGDFIVYLPVGSRIVLEQFGRSADCASNSFALVSCGDKLVHSKLGDNDTIYLGLPRAFVERRLRDPDRHCAGLVLAASGVGGLAASALYALETQAANIADEQLPSAAAAVGDLLMLAVERGADLACGISAVRVGNLARAKRVIRQRLADPELSPADVARACGLSLSYLHNLFRDDGRTLCQFLLTERLGRARTMLALGQVATVTAAALDCGFSNMSSFSTAFRAAFGVAPRDVLRSRETH